MRRTAVVFCILLGGCLLCAVLYLQGSPRERNAITTHAGLRVHRPGASSAGHAIVTASDYKPLSVDHSHLDVHPPGKARGKPTRTSGKTNSNHTITGTGRQRGSNATARQSGKSATSTGSFRCTPADIQRRSSTVVLATTNAGFLDVTENMLESIRRTRACPNITVIAEDEASYRRLSRRASSQPGLHVARSPSGGAPSRSMMVNSPDYNRFVNRRPRYVLSYLHRGYDVLFVDSDTVWFRDPFEDFQGSFDIAMVDEAKKKPRTIFCVGFAYFRRTPNTLRVVERWADLCEAGHTADQRILNDLISRRTVPDLSIKSLAPGNYPDGRRYFLTPGWRQEHTNTTVLHVTYILGHDAKVDALKAFGWWWV